MQSYVTRNELVEAVKAVLAKSNIVEASRDEIRKKYHGAYLSSLDLEDYPTSYVKTAKDFAKKNGLKLNQVGVVHDEGISHTDFVKFQNQLKKDKIANDVWDDSRSSGEIVVFFSLKESVNEASDGPSPHVPTSILSKGARTGFRAGSIEKIYQITYRQMNNDEEAATKAVDAFVTGIQKMNLPIKQVQQIAKIGFNA